MAGPRPTFSAWLQRLTKEYSALNDHERNATLDTLISASGSSQLLMLSTFLPGLVYRDFVRDLPLEVTVQILQYLDGKQLCVCCQVSRYWNECISSLSKLWMVVARDIGVKVSDYEGSNPDLRLQESNQPIKDENSDSGDSTTICAPLYKTLFRHGMRVLKGLPNGTSISVKHNYIEKDTWRITAVRYFQGCVVTGCDDHTVQVWSVPDGSVLYTVATNSVCCLTLSDRHLYTASFNANAECWDLLSGLHIKTFIGHTSAVLAIDVIPGETFLLTGSVDKTAKLWDLRREQHALVKTFDSKHEDWVFHVKFLPSEEDNQLLMMTCDSNMACLWKTDYCGLLISSCHEAIEGSAKFTSFYHHPNNLCQLFACQWTEWTKTSSFNEYQLGTKSLGIVQTRCFSIPMVGAKAHLLGAGLKFAVIMCSISRKDFFVLDVQRHTVIATIETPYFYILTRNGSTVTLGDTRWLDGFNFSQMQSSTPVFAAWIAADRVMLGTWAQHISQIECS